MESPLILSALYTTATEKQMCLEKIHHHVHWCMGCC